MKALPIMVQKLWPMFKFLLTDRQTDRVITIGHPPCGGGGPNKGSCQFIYNLLCRYQIFLSL